LLTRRQTPGIHLLSRTGMILGVFETGVWEQETVEIAPGEALVLYTDGIVEAQNAEGALFTERRLFDLMGSCHGQSAHQIQEALLTEVQHFVGDTAQTDDITCVILDRCA
jgi:sigma-B regulation protein RsbU (phosphoserine phosphatase)